MKIADLIENYYDLHVQLTEAIFQNEQKTIAQLDSKLSSTFEAILSSEASEQETAKSQAEFLLQHLSPKDHRSTLEARICEKIIDLAISE